MAVYTGNNDHLMIDGVNCDNYWRHIKVIPVHASEESTAGNTDTVERIPTLTDYQLELTIIYEESQIAALLPLVAVGVHTVVWGPQGNSNGLPKHQQQFIFEQSSTEALHDMSQARAFMIAGKSYKAPVFNMWKGDTF